MGKDNAERRPKMQEGEPGEKGALGKGQKICLLVALGLMLTGGALWALGPAWGDKPVRSEGGGDSNLATGLDSGGEPSPGVVEEESSTLNALSPAIFRVGFSFAVGFAIAFAARTFVRLSLIAVGIFLLALFGLEYAEVITVNWDKMEGHYDGFVASARESFGGFREFITGRLPSAASALAGLVIGFRKRG